MACVHWFLGATSGGNQFGSIYSLPLYKAFTNIGIFPEGFADVNQGDVSSNEIMILVIEKQ
jgi:hypothetical protein